MEILCNSLHARKRTFILAIGEESIQLSHGKATVVSRPENSQETEQPCHLAN